MLTALPDGTVIGYEPFVEDTSVFKKFIAMPEVSVSWYTFYLVTSSFIARRRGCGVSGPEK